MSKNYLQAAVEIAQEAGKILIEEFSRPLDIRYKGDEVDLVTQADKRSEQFIVSRLNEYFPGHAITAEEGTGQDTASEFRWHVDPLDGTTNFAHHYPCFCVSIALAERDTLLAAAIFNPYYNELYGSARRRRRLQRQENRSLKGHHPLDKPALHRLSRAQPPNQ